MTCVDSAERWQLTMLSGNSMNHSDLQVSAEERKMAAAAIGGKTAQLSVAFGSTAPVYDPAWNVKVSNSPLQICTASPPVPGTDNHTAQTCSPVLHLHHNHSTR